MGVNITTVANNLPQNEPSGGFVMTVSNTVTRFALGAIVVSLLASAVVVADDDTAAERQEMKELGLQYESAWALYSALKEEADGGQRLTWRKIPDWHTRC